MDHRNLTYPPVGRCIYCDNTDNLTREHIIPFFITSGWVLQKASCPKCAEITKGFERICGREMLGNLRDQFGLSTRRKKDRAARFAGGLPNPFTGGKFLPFGVPEYSQPGALSEAQKVPGFGDMHFQFIFPTIGRNLTRDTFPEKALVCINPTAFARMLAKIGFVSAVAQLGLNKTPKDLRPYILGIDPCISHVVGACAYPYPPAAPMMTDDKGDVQFEPFLVRHAILRHNGRRWLMAQIQLLRSFNTPTYWVIVGPSTDEIEGVVEAPARA